MTSCEGIGLRISHQQWGITFENFNLMKSAHDPRNKREVATTEELASELTAVEMRLMKLIEKLFDMQCQSSVREENPTIMARKLLKREDVMAIWKTRSLLEVYQCTPVPQELIRFRPTGNQCYKFVPTKVMIKTLGWINSFIDPVLSIISETSPLSNCQISRYHYLELNNTLYMFDSVRNLTVKVPPTSIHSLPPAMGLIHEALSIDSFHDLILTNESEVFMQLYHSQHVDELERIHEFKDEMVVKQTAQAKAISATPHTLPGVIESYLFGWLGIAHDIWINICSVLVSLYTLGLILYFCLPNGVVQPLRRINQLKNRVLRRNTESEIPVMMDDIDIMPGNCRSRSRDEPLEIQVFDRSPQSFRSRKKIEPLVRFRRSNSAERVNIENFTGAQDSLIRGESSRSSTVRKWANLFTTNSGKKRQSQTSTNNQ